MVSLPGSERFPLCVFGTEQLGLCFPVDSSFSFSSNVPLKKSEASHMTRKDLVKALFGNYLAWFGTKTGGRLYQINEKQMHFLTFNIRKVCLLQQGLNFGFSLFLIL